jgi:hypothetical protein
MNTVWSFPLLCSGAVSVVIEKDAVALFFWRVSRRVVLELENIAKLVRPDVPKTGDCGREGGSLSGRDQTLCRMFLWVQSRFGEASRFRAWSKQVQDSGSSKDIRSSSARGT